MRIVTGWSRRDLEVVGSEGLGFDGVAMLKKAVALMGAMLALVGLSSCLEMETVVSVKKDGSGTITENVKIGAQMAGMMAMGAEEGADPLDEQFGEEALKENAKKYGEGVELLSSERGKDDSGKITVQAVYKFADVNKVKLSFGGMMNDEESVEEEEDAPKLSMKDGVLTIGVPAPDGSDMGFGDEDMTDEQMAMMAPMMAGMKVSMIIKGENGIAETNATYHEGDSVTLFAMEMDEVLKNEGGLKAMKKLEVEGREEFGKAVKEVKGVDIESKETVTIKLK